MSPRIFRVFGTGFWTDEVMLAPQTHTDARLADVARLGFDGVWISAELRQLAPTPLFEDFEGFDRAARIEALKTVVARAKQHGLGIWLYLCEPRAYPPDHPFWAKHPECCGQAIEFATHAGWRWKQKRLPAIAMCLSAEPVRIFLRDATRELFTAVPDLAGLTVITSSEFHTHCFCRHSLKNAKPMRCPRCASRAAWEMPVEIGRAMTEGLRASGSPGKINFWTWGWRDFIEASPHPNVMEHLPREISITSMFESGEIVMRGGTPIDNFEYSFAITGPGRQFAEMAEVCRSQSRELWAKLQITATHEIATVPNLPVPGILYDKFVRARESGTTGALTIWTMGTLPTLNSFASGQLMANIATLPPREEWLRWLARAYFDSSLDDVAIGRLVHAWDGFAASIREHPLELAFLYYAPINYAPAYPWKLKREGSRMARSWTDEPWGDKLEMSAHEQGLPSAATQLERMATLWEAAIGDYREALEPLASSGNSHAREELSVAEACGLFFRSCADCYAFVLAAEGGATKEVLLRLIARERATCERLIPLMEADPRIGWHDELQKRMADPAKLREKLQMLKELAAQL